MPENDYDLFMSYSYADSKSIVGALVTELEALGLDVWYDGMQVELGDSIVDSIDDGLTNSNYGVVVLSKQYFEGTSDWELKGLVQRHTSEGNVILPLWYGIGAEEVREQSPSLADLRAEELDADSIQSIATEIYHVVDNEDADTSTWDKNVSDGSKELPSFTSIEIRFEERFDAEVGKEITIEAWRNHRAPNLDRFEAVKIRDVDRDLAFTSKTKGTFMTYGTKEDPKIKGVITDVGKISSGQTVFTMRVNQNVIDGLPTNRDYYKNGGF